MSITCKHCGKEAEEPTPVHWLWFILFLGGHWTAPGPYCEDCAGFANFMGFLAAVVFLGVAFVLAVIGW